MKPQTLIPAASSVASSLLRRILECIEARMRVAGADYRSRGGHWANTDDPEPVHANGDAELTHES